MFARFLTPLGNFKTPEREAYAVFTKPIYQNKPIGILIAKERAAAFAPYKSLAELTASTRRFSHDPDRLAES